MGLDTNFINTYHTKLFDKAVRFRLDKQRVSQLRGTVMERSGLTGGMHQVQGIGNTNFAVPASRGGIIANSDSSFPQRWVAPKPINEMAFRVYEEDKVMAQIDFTGPLVESTVQAAQRYIDDTILGFPGEVGGMLGYAWDGPADSQTQVALPASQLYGSDATFVCNYQLLLGLQSLFNQNQVPQELKKHIAITPIAYQQLIQSGAVITMPAGATTQGQRWGNADMIASRIAETGYIGELCGFSLHMVYSPNVIANNATVNPGRAPAGIDYLVAYCEMGCEFDFWGPFSPKTTVQQLWNESQQPWLIYSQIQGGAVRVMDTRVIRVKIDATKGSPNY